MINYFEFYNIPESFSPDEAALKKQFYVLSKQYHPDFFANESDEKQQEILELSTINNKAYQILSDPNKRVAYILQQHGLLEEGSKPQLPGDFLMEMMDINERLMEIESAEDLGKIGTEVLEIETAMQQELDGLTADYSGLDNTAKGNRLTKIADIYYRQLGMP